MEVSVQGGPGCGEPVKVPMAGREKLTVKFTINPTGGGGTGILTA